MPTTYPRIALASSADAIAGADPFHVPATIVQRHPITMTTNHGHSHDSDTGGERINSLSIVMLEAYPRS